MCASRQKQGKEFSHLQVLLGCRGILFLSIPRLACLFSFFLSPLSVLLEPSFSGLDIHPLGCLCEYARRQPAQYALGILYSLARLSVTACSGPARTALGAMALLSTYLFDACRLSNLVAGGRPAWRAARWQPAQCLAALTAAALRAGAGRLASPVLSTPATRVSTGEARATASSEAVARKKNI